MQVFPLILRGEGWLVREDASVWSKFLNDAKDVCLFLSGG